MILEINSAQRRELRARAHALHPVVMISDGGVSEAVMHEIDRSLTSHELIKVRVFADAHADRSAMLQEICENLSAAPVQHIGKILVIYRPKPDAAQETKKPSRRRKPPRRTKRSYQD